MDYLFSDKKKWSTGGNWSNELFWFDILKVDTWQYAFDKAHRNVKNELSIDYETKLIIIYQYLSVVFQ